MKKVGVLVGREVTFPISIIDKVNQRGAGEVVGELVKVGGVRHDEDPDYALIVDRISHQVPFYRAFLKRAALGGTIIINNPFWWSADDKFFNYSLAEKLDVATPRTVLLPQKDYIEDISNESLRNLEFPLDWEGIANYVGFPAIIKPFDGGGWKNVSKVENLEELWSVYDTTGTLCMTIQEMIDFDQFVRCYCVGQEEVMIMPYDPKKPYLSGEQYLHDPNYLSAELADRISDDVRKLCRALGYDLNTVEFAIKDGIPYAIDFMNPAPDAEVASVGEFYHNWVTDKVTDLIFKRLGEGKPAPRYTWDSVMNPFGSSPQKTLTAAASAVDSYIPDSVRDVSSGIASGVSDFVSDATGAVSELIGSVFEGTDADKPKPKSAAAPKTTAKPKTSPKKPATKAKKPRTEI